MKVSSALLGFFIETNIREALLDYLMTEGEKAQRGTKRSGVSREKSYIKNAVPLY